MSLLPKTKRGIALSLGGGLTVFAIAAFLIVYFVIFPTSSPKPFKLTPTASSSASGATGSSGASGASASTGAAVSAGSSLAGTWKIASGSEAGYRVREKLAFLPAESDAVGRTSQITGQAVFSEAGKTVTVTSASFTIAVNTLKSDRSMRDEKIHEIGLESSRYPTATFQLSKPLSLPAEALSGKIVHIPVTGVVNLHGTSKTETIPLEMSLSAAAVQAVGSLTFPWSEFNMTAPSVGGFVNVSEKATMEFELHLQRV